MSYVTLMLLSLSFSAAHAARPRAAPDDATG